VWINGHYGVQCGITKQGLSKSRAEQRTLAGSIVQSMQPCNGITDCGGNEASDCGLEICLIEWTTLRAQSDRVEVQQAFHWACKECGDKAHRAKAAWTETGANLPYPM